MVAAAVDAVYREQWGRILASLIRQSGSFDWAEDALQEAFAAALRSWPIQGIPANPAAWITRAANNKLIDLARRAARSSRHQNALTYELSVRAGDACAASPLPLHPNDETMNASLWPDDRLRLMFTCCHPALQTDAQVALCLRTLAGLTTSEIAKAFVLPEATLAQRLVRAKRRIKSANIPYEVPAPDQLPDRLTAVRAVLYLIFNEGYLAAFGSALVRISLCSEAIRLTRLLNTLLPDEPETLGLLALLLLQNSRRDARLDAAGNLVLLEDQDRSLWHRVEIDEAGVLLNRAWLFRSPGPYQLQAAIAAVHSSPSAAATDWSTIAGLYSRLLQWNNSPVVRLNRAVAIALSPHPNHGLAAGLALLDELKANKELEGYYLLPAARADLLRRSGRLAEACACYRQALQLVTNDVERRYLEGRLSAITPS